MTDRARHAALLPKSTFRPSSVSGAVRPTDGRSAPARTSSARQCARSSTLANCGYADTARRTHDRPGLGERFHDRCCRIQRLALVASCLALIRPTTLTVTSNVTVVDSIGAASTQPVADHDPGVWSQRCITPSPRWHEPGDRGQRMARRARRRDPSSVRRSASLTSTSPMSSSSIASTQVSATLSNGYTLTRPNTMRR